MNEVGKRSGQNNTYGELKFYIDSGCTDHLVNNKNFFTNLVMLKDPIKIKIAKQGDFMRAIGVGNIVAYNIVNNKRVEYKFSNVLYVPKLNNNLLSVKKMELLGMKIVFQNRQVLIYHDNELVGKAERKNNMK